MMSYRAGIVLSSAALIGLSWADAIAAADLATIRERGRLIVAVKNNRPPLGFEGDDGQLYGLEVDIARQLAAALLGNADAVTLVPVSTTDRIPLLLEGQVDLVVARLTVTEQRSRLVNFSRPYYYDGTALMTRQPELQTFADIGPRSVAVLTGSTTIDDLRWHLPQADLVGVSSYQDAYALLEAGLVSAFGADAAVLTGWTQAYPRYRLLPSLLSAEALSVATPRGLQYQSLQDQIDGAIESWHETGWLGDRIRYWGLPLDALSRPPCLQPDCATDGQEEILENLNQSGTLR